MSTWKVYQREWVTVFTSDLSGKAGIPACRGKFASSFEGTVLESEWRVVPFPEAPAMLQLFIPNLKGEYRSIHDAADHRQQIEAAGGIVVTVAHGSLEEKALLDYGRKKLA